MTDFYRSSEGGSTNPALPPSPAVDAMSEPGARPPLRDAQSPREWLSERLHAFRDLAVLGAAFDLGLGPMLAVPQALESLAQALDAGEPTRLEPLLDCLCREGLLVCEAGRFHLTPLGERVLVGPESLAPELAAFRSTAGTWLKLGAALKAAGPSLADPWPSWATPSQAEPFADRTRAAAEEVFAAIGGRAPEPSLLVDVGCGGGTFTRTFLERQPTSRAVLIDRGPIVAAAHAALVEAGFADRIEAWAGDVADHPGLAADLVLVSNVCHAYRPEVAERLVCDAALLLRPGGTIAIRDLRVDRTGAGPRVGADYALGMALFASEGGIHPTPRVREWLEAANLGRIEELETRGDPGCYLIVAQARS
jgi:SAM-dependent methyltransferase